MEFWTEGKTEEVTKLQAVFSSRDMQLDNLGIEDVRNQGSAAKVLRGRG